MKAGVINVSCNDMIVRLVVDEVSDEKLLVKIMSKEGMTDEQINGVLKFADMVIRKVLKERG